MAIHKAFSQSLLDWYQSNGRHDLPWKQDFISTGDAYYIWLSEIMLQQTQVSTVLTYYQKFTAQFANVLALANADNEQVMALWSGLGYYARARNLHATAKIIRDQYNGVFPSDVDALVALPGIGRSTAAAIVAFSTGKKHAILDANVKRVLARLYAIETATTQAQTEAQLWQLADKHTPDTRDSIKQYTQAIMDFGATVCVRTPVCVKDKHLCFASDYCLANKQNKQKSIPVKKVAKLKPVKYKALLMLGYSEDNADYTYLQKRPSKGIWNDLWSLPEVDFTEAVNQKLISHNDENLVSSALVKSRAVDILQQQVNQFIDNGTLYLTIAELFGIIAIDNTEDKSQQHNQALINEARAIYKSQNSTDVKPPIKHSFSHYDMILFPITINLTESYKHKLMGVNNSHHNNDAKLSCWLSMQEDEINNMALPAPILKLLLAASKET